MRTTRSADDFVAAAVEIADEQGLEALNTRVLGERLGTHPTAVYRHFRDWDSLLLAVTDELMGRLTGPVFAAMEAAPTPRDALLMLVRAFRAAARAQPPLARMILSILEADSVVPTPNLHRVTAAIIAQLRAMGLEGADLTRAHQAAESTAMGAILFDFSGYPRHLAHRRARRQAVPVAEFTVSAATDEAVDATNEDAFEFSVNAVLDAIEAMAARASS